MKLREVSDWVAAAREDGWIVKPTYEGESVLTAATLEKEGFRAMAIARPAGRQSGIITISTDSVSLHLWGPDGLAIDPPMPYSWFHVLGGLSLCRNCGARGETYRLGFANRVCGACRSKLRPTVEPPGWSD